MGSKRNRKHRGVGGVAKKRMKQLIVARYNKRYCNHKGICKTHADKWLLQFTTMQYRFCGCPSSRLAC